MAWAEEVEGQEEKPTGAGTSAGEVSEEEGAEAPKSPEEVAAEAVAEEAPDQEDGADAESVKANELDKGKHDYNKGNYDDAIKAWNRSMMSVKYILDKNLYKDKPEQLQEVYDMELKLCVNLAQGYLKTGDWNKAIESADKALKRDADNSKALYRKASAQMSLLNFNEAAEVLERLMEVDPANAAGKAMLAEARRNATVGERKAKEMSKKIFAGMAKESDPRVLQAEAEAAAAPSRGRAAADDDEGGPSLLASPLEWFRELPRLCRDLPRFWQELLEAGREEAWRLWVVLVGALRRKLQSLDLFLGQHQEKAAAGASASKKTR